MTNLQSTVTGLFPVVDKQELFVHVESFAWDFSPGLVQLICGADSVVARQVGSGNHEGHAAVLIRPRGSWDELNGFVRRNEGRPDMKIARTPANGD
jgi:hypothetical protein